MLSKLYIYNNVILVGHCNGSECYNTRYNTVYIGFYNIFNIFNRFYHLLGSSTLLGLLISSLTESGLRLRLRTSRAAYRLEFLKSLKLLGLKLKCSLFYGDKCVDHLYSAIN